ncbi:MAG: TrkA family potassium uptake protein [Acidimicrobiia bacterium]|nr:MAG: TrkA family potassium uptake protein [Acidimicrobiia bacterium]
MRVVIAGCGRVGRQVALLLSGAGDDVSVVDSRPESADALGLSFDGTFHQGMVYDVDVLIEAGIKDADAFLAVTNSDNANLMAAQIAKEVFGVSRSIARLDDPTRERSYRALNVDFVAGTHLVAQVMVERIREPDFAYHVSFPSGDVQVLEMVVGDHASGVTIRALEREGRLRVAAVRRGDKVMVGDPEMALESGDIVVAGVKLGSERELRAFLAAEGGET